MVDDDAVLVRQCLDGDEAAMRDFVERFQGAVFGLCFRMLAHREDAEDVAQDVFLRAFRSLHRWDFERPLKPWLLTIAANRCRTVFEKRMRQPAATEHVENLPDDSASTQARELKEELQAALEKLRHDYRICFTLFYQQELSCAEIGEILGRPAGTVKTWLHRARRELAEHLTRMQNATLPVSVNPSSSE